MSSSLKAPYKKMAKWKEKLYTERMLCVLRNVVEVTLTLFFPLIQIQFFSISK